MGALNRDFQRYNYSDYSTWSDGKRRELIDGAVFMMSPGPSWLHQELSVNLSGQLYNYLKGKPCRVLTAPLDVRLNADATDDTVVQPDIIVVCDRSKLSETGCIGAPDMVIEILSPSTSRLDRTLKFNKYLQAGVREYWIVDPDTKSVSVYILKDGEYMTRVYTDADTAPVHVLEGCTINLKELFDET